MNKKEKAKLQEKLDKVKHPLDKDVKKVTKQIDIIELSLKVSKQLESNLTDLKEAELVEQVRDIIRKLETKLFNAKGKKQLLEIKIQNV